MSSNIVFDRDIRKQLKGVDNVRYVTEDTGEKSDKGKEIHNYLVYQGDTLLMKRKAYKGIREDGTIYFMVFKDEELQLTKEEQNRKIESLKRLFNS